jgi:hypothetical protein
MNRYLHLLLITWVGLLFPAACQPTAPSPAEPTHTPTITPSPTPPAGGTGNADVLHVKAVQAAAGIRVEQLLSGTSGRIVRGLARLMR